MALQFTTHIATLNDTDDLNYLEGTPDARFAANSPAKCAPVNAFLHETTLVVTALMSYVNATASTSYAPNASEANIKAAIETAIKKTEVETAQKVRNAFSYTVNGTTKVFDGLYARSFEIYAPTTAGTQYQAVISNGANESLIYADFFIQAIGSGSSNYCSISTSAANGFAIGSSSKCTKLQLYDRITVQANFVDIEPGVRGLDDKSIYTNGGIYVSDGLPPTGKSLNISNNAYIQRNGKIVTNNVIESGDITSSGTVKAGVFVATSDIRKKENIKDYVPSKSILDLPIKEFDFKSDKSHHIGCIAQDLQQIAPELVHENEEGYLNIEENKLVYLLLDEVKKLRAELDELKGAKK